MRFRKVRIFHNRRSGPWYTHLSKIQAAMDESWAKDCEDIAWYFPASREQCLAMLEHAMDDGTDCVLASGGDGTVSSIGVRLLGTGIPLGVIPLGSGNGVARHFNQSLSPAKSVAQLAEGQIVDMDVWDSWPVQDIKTGYVSNWNGYQLVIAMMGIPNVNDNHIYLLYNKYGDNNLADWKNAGPIFG